MTIPVPDIKRRDIYELEPKTLLRRGVRLVFLDVDNTLMPYGTDKATPELCGWVEKMKNAGLELFILSNNKGKRPEIFARQLGLEFVGRARKPKTEKLLSVCEEKGLRAQECALVGDQIYTDILCARRAGAVGVLVRPIRFSNPFFVIRYIAELPFRCVNKEEKS